MNEMTVDQIVCAINDQVELDQARAAGFGDDTEAFRAWQHIDLTRRSALALRESLNGSSEVHEGQAERLQGEVTTAGGGDLCGLCGGSGLLRTGGGGRALHVDSFVAGSGTREAYPSSTPTVAASFAGRYWSEREAAAYLGITVHQVRRLRGSGKLAFHQVGNAFRHTREDCEACVESTRTVESPGRRRNVDDVLTPTPRSAAIQHGRSKRGRVS